MNVSANGLKLIMGFESLRLTAYLPTPHDVPTIGYGHTQDVKMGDTCTNEQAEEWLNEDLKASELAIECSVAVPLNQNQFDALTSFVFNIGVSAYEHSTLLKLLNAGDYVGASSQFLAWNRQGGKVLNGLTHRRMIERALFDTPI